MKRIRRLPRELWHTKRLQVWLRDQGRCQGPYCQNMLPGSLPLRMAHIDHRRPLSGGGGNHLSNLRVLCRRCHVLRANHAHQGMIARALADEIIPPDWRAWVWDDEEG